MNEEFINHMRMFTDYIDIQMLSVIVQDKTSDLEQTDLILI